MHELVDALDVPQPLVSQHLRILKAAGVVEGERSGREVLYRLVDHHLAHIVLAAVTHAEEDDDVTGAGRARTRQRAAITALLENLDDFRSAQELHDELRRRGEDIGLTTVYRTLQSMVGRRRRRHVAHRHRRVGVPALLDPAPPSPGVPQVRLHRRGAGRPGRGVGRGGRAAHGFSDVEPHDRDLRHVRALRA